MTYEEWEKDLHERVRAEPIWQFLGYRKALFFYELAWQDCEKLVRDRRGRARDSGAVGSQCWLGQCQRRRGARTWLWQTAKFVLYGVHWLRARE